MVPGSMINMNENHMEAALRGKPLELFLLANVSLHRSVRSVKNIVNIAEKDA